MKLMYPNCPVAVILGEDLGTSAHQCPPVLFAIVFCAQWIPAQGRDDKCQKKAGVTKKGRDDQCQKKTGITKKAGMTSGKEKAGMTKKTVQWLSSRAKTRDPVPSHADGRRSLCALDPYARPG